MVGPRSFPPPQETRKHSYRERFASLYPLVHLIHVTHRLIKIMFANFIAQIATNKHRQDQERRSSSQDKQHARLTQTPNRRASSSNSDNPRAMSQSFAEFRLIQGKQCTQCIFIVGEMCRNVRHGFVGPFLHHAHLIFVTSLLSRLIDQLTQRNRCATRLQCQPFPMAR